MAAGAARAVDAAAPQVTTLPCFHAQVRLESVCKVLAANGAYADCARQTLHTPQGQVQLLGARGDLHAAAWACSSDQKTLVINLVNGGNCPQCEAGWAFDVRAHRLKKLPPGRPEMTFVDLAPAQAKP